MKDIIEHISINDWREGCRDVQTQTLNTRFKFLQYNWLMRVLINPVFLNKLNEDIKDICPKWNNPYDKLKSHKHLIYIWKHNQYKIKYCIIPHASINDHQ